MIGISRETYYHKPSHKERQLADDFELKEAIEDNHIKFPGYDYRRIHQHFLREGKRINEKRIKRVMKNYSLLSCVRKLMRHRGSYAGIKLHHPNLIHGLKVNGLNQV